MQLPPPYTTRPATADDAAAVAALITTYEAALGDDQVTTTANVREQIEDADTTVHLITDETGTIVAAVIVATSIDEPGAASIDDYVDHAIGEPLIRPVLALGESVVGPEVTLLRSFGHPDDEPRNSILVEQGWRVVTGYDRMHIDLPTPRPAYPPLPAGVELRNPSSDELPIVHRIIVESFAEHHGDPEASDLTTWLEHQIYDGRAHDLGLWWLAFVDGEPMGALVGTTRNDGWVKKIGVLEAARGRGVGRALLLSAFARFGERGSASVGLGVDTNNVTGAGALYASVGMRAVQRYLAWEKPRREHRS